ncbi:hypothetical protein [Microbacterium sp. USHLN186]|uniref:hypothetical protein n=1 Tax=Microbacterium sp. USHLN186 TaxID=3081286 RepID=UPI0030160CC1
MSFDKPHPSDDDSALGVGSAAVPQTEDARDADDDGVLYEDQVQPEYGIVGFTLRELLIVGAWLVLFIVSFFPVSTIGGSVWTTGISWILMVGVPTVAVFLVLLRRFSPAGIRRVGSLGIDQFASVAAAVAAVSWAQVLWQQIAGSVETGVLLVGWVAVLAQLATLALVATTVAAPLLPRLREDFHGRLETLAHRNANPVRPVISRPRAERPVKPAGRPAAPAPDDAGTAGTDAPTTRGVEVLHNTAAVEALQQIFTVDDERAHALAAAQHNTAADGLAGEEVGAEAAPRGHYTDVDPGGSDPEDGPETRAHVVVQPADPGQYTDTEAEHAADGPARPEPFWILAPTERDVLDEHGQPLFRVGPTAWALALEDRGGAFVVRHEDGRIGYLHDISDITKG